MKVSGDVMAWERHALAKGSVAGRVVRQARRLCVSGIVAGLVLLPRPAIPAERPTIPKLQDQITFAPALELAMPAVVSIAVKGHTPIEQSPLYHHPLFSRFGLQRSGAPGTREFVSSASGVVVDGARGLILTNMHPLTKAEEIKVQLPDGRELAAKLIGSDPPTDIAVLRVESSGLPKLAFADSDKVRVGDIVFAIGAPFGLQGTATMGMVSAVMRSGVGHQSYESFLQVDAAVNAGNSGGPLVDQRGELIGINTAILSPVGANVGIGFAIPANIARWVMDQLMTHGRVRRGSIGVHTSNLTPEIREARGITSTWGAFISSVQPDSPAGKAGLTQGAVIVGLQGEAVHSATAFMSRIAIMEVGRDVDLEIMENGQRRRVKLTISDIKTEQERLVLSSTTPRLAGVTIGSIEPASALFGAVKGVEVLEVRKFSRAALSGLVAGDIIVKIDSYQVRMPEDVVEFTKNKNRKIKLDVLRQDVPVRITLR